jgi:hypothetical protein
MDNKCYICYDTEGILKKTCINDKCTAVTHTSCIQIQHKTLIKCGVCQSRLRYYINRTYSTIIKFLFLISNLILKMSILLNSSIELKNINNNITIKYILYDYDVTSLVNYYLFSYSYIILFLFFLFDYFIHARFVLYHPNKNLLSLCISETIFFILCYILGYNLCYLFYDQCMFLTNKTFVIGLIFSLSIVCILLIPYLILCYIFPVINP